MAMDFKDPSSRILLGSLGVSDAGRVALSQNCNPWLSLTFCNERPVRCFQTSAMNNALQFENVVFAGGGNRCFWQAGFWSVAAATLSWAPVRVAAVSAGSAIACALFSGRFDAGFAGYKQAIADNSRNLYLRNILRAQPVFPHASMYRDAILGSIDAGGLSRLHAGPEIMILLAYPPRWASPLMSVLLGAVAVGLNVWGQRDVHFSMGCRMGFKSLHVSVRECKTPGALADLILASSCVPPLTPQARRGGVALLDGGLVSNVPVEGLAQNPGDTLVLLTRPYAALPRIPGRLYVQPSQPVPVGAWDYTNESALQAAFDLGRSDGEQFCTLRGYAHR
jgi:predicted acylesterase/phospholipase RssA